MIKVKCDIVSKTSCVTSLCVAERVKEWEAQPLTLLKWSGGGGGGGEGGRALVSVIPTLSRPYPYHDSNYQWTWGPGWQV